MALAHITTNTTKEYPCTRCGSLGNIVREGNDPRVKCNNSQCGFTYSASDSLAAKEADSIPHGLPEPARSAHEENRTAPKGSRKPSAKEVAKVASTTIPRSPTHIIISKSRKTFEFATAKTLNQLVLEWVAQKKRFDVFELVEKTVDTKVNIN